MSKRQDFETSLAEYLVAMMNKVAKERGGINEVINDLFLVENDPTHFGTESYITQSKKRQTDKSLSNKSFKVAIDSIYLDSVLKPHWVYWVKFFNDEKSAWNIEDMFITIKPDNTYESIKYFIKYSIKFKK
jgi:hypothetical protein